MAAPDRSRPPKNVPWRDWIPRSTASLPQPESRQDIGWYSHGVLPQGERRFHATWTPVRRRRKLGGQDFLGDRGHIGGTGGRDGTSDGQATPERVSASLSVGDGRVDRGDADVYLERHGPAEARRLSHRRVGCGPVTAGSASESGRSGPSCPSLRSSGRRGSGTRTCRAPRSLGPNRQIAWYRHGQGSAGSDPARGRVGSAPRELSDDDGSYGLWGLTVRASGPRGRRLR